jgi:hypothetical protein
VEIPPTSAHEIRQVARPEVTTRIAPLFANESEVLRHEIVVRNDTSDSVRFVEVQPACSCSGAKLDRNELGPGQQTKLHLEANLHGRFGEQRFRCTLIDDAGGRWPYALETTVYRAAQFAETGALHLGLIDPNSEVTGRTQLLFYSRSRAGPAPSVRVHPELPRIEASVGEPIFERPNDEIYLTTVPILIRLQAPSIAGPGQAAIVVVFNGENSSSLRQEVCWTVRSLIKVEPRQVFFGSMEEQATGQTRTRLVTVRREDGKPIRVKSVRLRGEAVEAAVDSESDKRAAVLRFSLHAEQLRETLWDEAEVETDHPLQPLIRIPVACVIRRKPSITDTDTRKELMK